MIPRTAIPIDAREIATAVPSLLGGEYREDVARFENDLAAYLGVKRAFAFNYGRTALYTAIQALKLKPGEEIIVPAYVCAIVFELVLRLGLKSLPVDVNPETCNIDPELIAKSITSKTRALIAVHLFGRPCEMDQVMEIANKHGLYVIEDVAQALGAEYEKVKGGTFGDLAIFSFGPGKSITSGEGGATVVNNEELIENVTDVQAKLANPNSKGGFHLLRNIIAMRVFANPYLYPLIRKHVEEYVNQTDAKICENCVKLTNRKDDASLHRTVKLEKMPLFSAEIARIQLRKLDQINEKRIMNALTLTKLLSQMDDYIRLPEISNDIKNTFTRYVVRVVKGSRDNLVKELMERGIDTGKGYDYLTRLFEILRINAPNAVTLANSVLTIPNHPLVKELDMLQIADALRNQLDVDLTI